MRFLSSSFSFSSCSVILGAVILGGCSLARTPLGVGTDAGTLDAPPLDSPALDAPEIDTGMPDVPVDTGITCTDREARCEGDAVVRCEAGVPSREDCNASGAYCEAAVCVPRVCIPNAITCEGTMEMRCDARGATSTSADCVRGCAAGVGCAPETACALSVLGTVPIGTAYRINTCGAGDDSVFTSACTRVVRSGPDVIARVSIATAGRYGIDLERVRPGTDPVLYIRTACADGATELACNDDASGTTYNSRIEIHLAPGDYFLMLDTFRDDDESLEERCGEMDIVVNRL